MLSSGLKKVCSRSTAGLIQIYLGPLPSWLRFFTTVKQRFYDVIYCLIADVALGTDSCVGEPTLALGAACVSHGVLYRSRVMVHRYGTQSLTTPLGYAHREERRFDFIYSNVNWCDGVTLYV